MSKEEKRAYNKQWYEAHKEELAARHKQYREVHKEDRAAYQKKWNGANKEKRAAHAKKCYLKKNYGITPEDFDAMFEAQNRGCAICGGVNKDGKRLHVDHNHETGEVRGLLCNSCNTAIGSLKEDESLFLNAIFYLRIQFTAER